MKNKPVNQMRLEIESKSINEGFARYAVSAFAAQLDPTIEELADLRCAVSEAVTNAIIHGYRGTSGTVYITAKYYEDRTVKIKVADKGVGIEDIKQAMQPLFTTDPSGERGGMGFAVMQSFTDKLAVRSKPGKGTTVTMTKKFAPRD
ncbi:MAG: anti-sigma F factor [Eubacteriales bacterium]|jgi:stage II sporulation protein AB (anti-sigma F factor)